MKNFLLYLSLIVILPTSFGKPDSGGCNSKKSDYTEEKSEQEKKEIDKKEEGSKIEGSKDVSNDISCYPFLSYK